MPHTLAGFLFITGFFMLTFAVFGSQIKIIGIEIRDLRLWQRAYLAVIGALLLSVGWGMYARFYGVGETQSHVVSDQVPNRGHRQAGGNEKRGPENGTVNTVPQTDSDTPWLTWWMNPRHDKEMAPVDVQVHSDPALSSTVPGKVIITVPMNKTHDMGRGASVPSGEMPRR